MLVAVEKLGFSLKFASERLKENKDIALEAVKNNSEAFICVTNKIKDNKEIVLEAIKNSGDLLSYVSERLRDDKEVVLEAIQNNEWALKYASNRLKDDKDVLEVLEKKDVSDWFPDSKNWHQEKMEILANIRRLEEKELLENSIINSMKTDKKVKF